MELKYLLKVFIIAFLLLSAIVFINSIGFNFNEAKTSKELLKVITLEGLETNPLLTNGNKSVENPIMFNQEKSFCDSHKGFDLELSCNKLTNSNCNLTSCCVWTSDQKCKAGNQNGPIFNSDSNGKTISTNYYFQNKHY